MRYPKSITKLVARRLVVAAASALLLMSLLPGLPVGAADPPPLNPELWAANDRVSASVVSGNTLYIGGTFTRVGPATGGWVGLRDDTAARRTDLPRVAGTVSAMLADGSGGWYIGGLFSAVDGVERGNLAHINADGTLDATWDPATNGEVRALARHGSSLYVGGSFDSVDGQFRGRVAAINATSGALQSWAPSVSSASNPSVYALAATADSVIIGGFFTDVSGSARTNLAAVSAANGAVSSWNPTPNNGIFALLIDGDNLYAGGSFSNIASTARNRLVAFSLSTGSLTAWNPNVSGGIFNPRVAALALDGSTLYVGGDFSGLGGKTRNAAGAVSKATGLANDWDPNPSLSGFVSVSALAPSGGVVYLAGNFTQVGGQARDFLAATGASDGSATTWHPQMAGPVAALGVSGNTLFAGGSFTTLAAERRNRLAALDRTTGQLLSWNPDVSNGSFITTMAITGSTIYFGGLFQKVGGQDRENLAAVDASSGAVTAFRPDPSNTVAALAIRGNIVFVGGSFLNIGGQSRFGLAATDAATGDALAGWQADINGPFVSALAVASETLYVGGAFTTLKGQPRSKAGAVDASTATLLPFNPTVTAPGGGFNGSVDAIAVRGSTVFLGGSFDQVGGQPRNNLAAVDAASGALQGWQANVTGSSAGVDSLLAHGETLFVGGVFTGIAGQGRRNLAALDAASAAVRAWEPDAGGNATTLLSVNAIALSGGTAYVGGTFRGLADQPQGHVGAVAAVQAKTDPPLNVGDGSATLRGTATAYTDPNASAAFVWGTAPGGPYPNVAPATPSPLASANPISVTAVITGVVPAQAYYYRLRLTTTGGDQVLGSERSFSTGSRVFMPVVTR